MHLRSPLVASLALSLFVAPLARAAEPTDLLSVRPTFFVGSDDVDRGAFTPSLHLGVTGRTRELAPGLTAQVELSLDADADLGLTDNSSYLRFDWRPSGWDDGQGLSFTVLPLHADRLYLGYAFPLTDLGGAYSPFASSSPRAPVTGLSLRLTRRAWYAFTAVKSTMKLNPLELESYRQYTVMVGGGLDLLPLLRVEAEGSHADLGLVPGDANQGIRAPVDAWGAAARLLFHQGIPIGPPTDFERYQHDPGRWEEQLAPEAYDGGLSSSVSAEALSLSQHGLDGAVFGQPVNETSVGYALEGRVKWKKLRGFLRGQYRPAALLWTDAPGLPPYKAISAAGTTHGELSATATADWHFARTGLTPGLSFGVLRPASLESPVPPGGNNPPIGLVGRTVVFEDNHALDLLPDGDSPLLNWVATATLRWELGQLCALGEAFVRRNPNRTTFRDSAAGVAEPVYASATQVGFDLLVQLRF